MSRFRIPWQSLLAYAPLVLLAVMGWQQRWIGDDGFINLRVAENLLRGDGFTYNPGERVEAVTSPLWLAFITIIGAVGAPMDTGAVLLGEILTVAGVGAGISGCRLLLRNGSGNAPGIELPVGALAYAAIPAAWDYVTSGLENGLSVAWLGCSYRLLASIARAPRRAPALTAATCLGMGPLVRPEMALYSAILLPLLVVQTFPAEASWKERMRTAAPLLALSALPNVFYQLFRMGYFASMVPNTALAKEAFTTNWDQGFYYFHNTFSLYRLHWPIALCTLLVVLTIFCAVRNGEARSGWLPGLTLAAGALHVVYVIRVGGDFMHARMFLPGLFALFLPAAVVAPARLLPLPRWPAVAIAGAVAVWAAVCGRSWRVAIGNDHSIGDERGWHARLASVPNPTRLEDYRRFYFYGDALRLRNAIARGCPHGDASLAPASTDLCKRVVMTDSVDGALTDRKRTLTLNGAAVPDGVVAVLARRPLGIAGLVLGSRVRIVDHHGLADPIASRMEAPKRRGRPGHEKKFHSVWLVARYAAPGQTSDPRVRAAALALGCGALSDIAHATRDPLDFGRFWANVALSWKHRNVRVPTDAMAAERKFCRG